MHDPAASPCTGPPASPATAAARAAAAAAATGGFLNPHPLIAGAGVSGDLDEAVARLGVRFSFMGDGGGTPDTGLGRRRSSGPPGRPSS